MGFDPAGVDVTLVVGIHPPRVILRPGKRRACAADEDAGVMVVIGLAVGGARRGVGEPAGTWAAISFPTKPIAPAPASTQRWDRLCGWISRLIASTAATHALTEIVATTK